jgi:hypothetical protein
MSTPPISKRFLETGNITNGGELTKTEESGSQVNIELHV